MSPQQYRNIMELLVEQEVNRQLSKFSPQVAQYFRSVEIITYALNRLPSLYACSERGLEQQMKKAKQSHSQEITQAVRWAIMAIRQDPLRQFIPIDPQQQGEILQELRHLLKDDSVTWETLPQTVEEVITALTYGETLNNKPSPDDQHIKSALTWQNYKKNYQTPPNDPPNPGYSSPRF